MPQPLSYAPSWPYVSTHLPSRQPSARPATSSRRSGTRATTRSIQPKSPASQMARAVRFGYCSSR